MSHLDIFIVVLYLAAMLAIGIISSRRHKTMEDYYVAGRNLGVLPIACLWVSSWIGGASVIGASSRAYDFGISGVWYVATIAIGLVIFSLTSPPIIKRLGDKFNNLTYPDLIEERYGTGARVLSTITTILAFIGHTAGQLIAAGSILHVVTGWDSGICFVVAAAITVLYTTIGGYFAVTNTDLLQVALLIVGVSFLGVIFSGKALDTAGLSLMSLPESYFDIGAWGWPTIIAMSISIIFSFYTCMDSYTRCYAARDTKTAKNGALLALVGVLLIAGASTYLGMVAKVILPDLATSSDSAASLILATFPRGVCGLVMAGILAAIMSTGDICILTVSANVTQDIYHRFINPKASDKRLLRIGMLVSLVVGILSTIFAWFMGDVMDTLLIAFTVNSAGLFLPTVCGFVWKKANAKAAVVSISASLVVVLFWFIMGQLGVGGIFAVDPLWPGLIASAVTFIPLCLFSKPTQGDIERCEKFMAASAENS